MRFLLSLVLLFSFFTCFAQDAKKEERILYIIDNVPIISDPDESMGTLSNNDIDHVRVVTNKDSIGNSGYTAIDKIIYISTKEYVKRPDEIKMIQTTKLMDKKDGVWYLKNSSVPYSGKFIDYFLNGKVEGDGTLKNGLVNGIRTVYYLNGNKSYFRNFVNGVSEGYSEEYFLNGKIKQKGSFKDGKDDGLWQDFYSTGDIKRQSTFVNLKPNLTKDEEKFYAQLEEAKKLIQSEDYKGAIKKLDQAEKLNSKYSDMYFYRGTAKLDNLDFDSAILDLNKAIDLEPLYMEALANRAFARIRKYEFKNSRTLNKTSEVTILASKDKVEIPVEEKNIVCSDLQRSKDLGDNKQLILDALKNYCN
jgi:antitoxin component YwqK of YwqJK toxin-antitoxin module